ncbi:MAG: hypothetical protein ISR65_09630 [Bacteriovoracaceae bacterium]|nr:hypothetical protein [Bacteriovoracaceae bacterium]
MSLVYKLKISSMAIMLLVSITGVQASLLRTKKKNFGIRRRNIHKYPQIAAKLIKDKLHFSAVPLIKEYLSSNRATNYAAIDHLIEQVITTVGVKQFEILPERILSRSKAPTIRYILAKKYFRLGKYSKALRELNRTIPRNHSVKPFALLLEGSISSIKKNYGNAISAFKECITASNQVIGNTKSEVKIKQLEINRDYCILGVPRTEFALGNYDKANFSYLDLPKSSYIWPEILFEEAWNSFYMKNYNRTLGKLVTYKAPIFTHIFNPEIDVLMAMAYLKLCLWSDSKAIIDSFYAKYQKANVQLGKFIKRSGRDYKYYYLLGKAKTDGRSRGSSLLNQILSAIVRDATYLDLTDALKIGRQEANRVGKLEHSSIKVEIIRGLRESLSTQKKLIGLYVLKELKNYKYQLDKVFEGLSYIKLEILAQKKSVLYKLPEALNRGRGDIANLQRTSKQYFWAFNGEFWADELGDYVFSLKPECGK